MSRNGQDVSVAIGEIVLRQLPSTLRVQDFDGIANRADIAALEVGNAQVAIAYPAAIELGIKTENLDRSAIGRIVGVAGSGIR